MRQPLGEYQDPDPPFGLVGEQRAEEEYPERRRRLPLAVNVTIYNEESRSFLSFSGRVSCPCPRLPRDDRPASE